MLDVTGRLIVIIGGGGVAARKARGLIEAGASKIRIVSPSFRADIPEGVERVMERYEARHLDGAGLVFVATDSAETNDAVVLEARRRGVLVNRADGDDANPGDFSTPAMARQGAIVVTVSAAGSPALAALVRDGIASRFDPRWRAMAEAMGRLRPMILASGMSAEQRREAFMALATEEALDVLAKGGRDGLGRWLMERFEGLRHEN